MNTYKNILRVDDAGLLSVVLPDYSGKTVEVTVRLPGSRRSRQANNYYWGVLVHSIAEHTGYSMDETHALLKSMFAKEIRYLCDEETGEIVKEVEVPMSTRTMTKQQFTTFIDRVTQLCYDLGIVLPAWEGDLYQQ